jgi:hypothetical protein
MTGPKHVTHTVWKVNVAAVADRSRVVGDTESVFGALRLVPG